MPQTSAQIEARLVKVRAAIDAILDGKMAEFSGDGGDGGKLLSLTELRSLERSLEEELVRLTRVNKTRFVRATRWAVLFALLWPLQEANAMSQIVAGAGIEPATLSAVSGEAPAVQSLAPKKKVGGVTYTPHYRGAVDDKFTFDFQPPHRSGNAAVGESWDKLTRRIRWLIDNTYMIKRAVNLMVQMCVGDGINVYFGGVDEPPADADPQWVRSAPLFMFGDESDGQFERWADRYADVQRRRSLYELQSTSAGDLFGTGNSLWLKVVRRAPDGVCPISYQLLEAEQLDNTKDRPQTDKQTRIQNGIEYDRYGEAIAYHLWDAHPYDTFMGSLSVLRGKSERVPANRVIHLALTTRASQDFGISFANILMQPSRDEDWLVGHELTSAALAAGLTIALRESENDDGSITFDVEGNELSEPAAFGEPGDGIPHISEVGLTAGTIARLNGPDESIEIVESKRPNQGVEPFARFLMNRSSMAAGLSYHRFTGNPTGASFATLRAMINDDRAMSEPLTRAIGRHVGARIRRSHDGLQAALGRYRHVTAAAYGRDLATYQDYDVLGPPLRLLNPIEDIKAARMRISSGMSTLRRECGLLGLPYRRVLKQLAVEKDLALAFGLALDFSSGGGTAPDFVSLAAGDKINSGPLQEE